MRLVVDPGLRACGCSLWSEEGQLLAAGFPRNPVKSDRGPGAWAAMAAKVMEWACMERKLVELTVLRLVVEVPKVYPGPRQKGDPDDLVQIAGVVGSLAGHFSSERVVWFHPRDWKGTVDGDVYTQRIKDHLTVEETSVVGKLIKNHNVLDSVGLAKFYFKWRKYHGEAR